MGFGSIKGKARVNPSHPQAFGVCDAGGEWRQRSELIEQLEYFGPELRGTGFYVCREHYDKPQDQLRPIILPPDPVPIKIPRPEDFYQDMMLQGFAQYVLFLPPFAIQSEANVQAALAQASGIPVPVVRDWSSTVARQNVSQIMVPGINPNRNYLAIYNPANPELQISISGTAAWGVRTNLILGPGEALLWSSSMSAVYTGAVNAIGLIPNVPYYAWEAPVTGPQFALVIPFNGPGNLDISPDVAPAIYSVALAPASYNLRVNLPVYNGTWEGTWTVKDTKGIAASNPISIYPPTGLQIDGYGINQPYTINFPYQSVSFAWDKYQGKYILGGI